MTIRGKKYFPWRAVDQYGNVQDILVQNRRNKQAVMKIFRKLLKGLKYVPLSNEFPAQAQIYTFVKGQEVSI